MSERRYDYLAVVALAKAQGSSVAATPYSDEFVVSDWTAGDSADTLSIAATTHKKGVDITVDVFKKNGSVYEMYSGYPQNGLTVSIDSDGNVTLSTESGDAFDGKIVIL